MQNDRATRENQFLTPCYHPIKAHYHKHKVVGSNPYFLLFFSAFSLFSLFLSLCCLHTQTHTCTPPPSQLDLALVLPAFGCCILLQLLPKMVLTLCNLHWWCFSCHQLAQRPHLHLPPTHHHQLALVVFY